MKVTLFMATSINGYIAGKNDDTEWVKDFEALYQIISNKKVCVMGRRTYDECVKFNAFPYKNALNIVMTHDRKLLDQSTPDAIFTTSNPVEVLKLVESKGYQELLVIGGGHINSRFLSVNLIDEVIIDIHPIIINEGIRLFENTFPRTNLELMESTVLTDGMVQNKYKVLK